MITDEERNEIINAAVEKALLLLPDVVGNLITNQVNLLRMNKEFYAKFPDFAMKKDIVALVVEYVEGQHPGLDYREILDKAVPIIKERIKTSGVLDTATVPKPNRDLRLSLPDNGEL